MFFGDTGRNIFGGKQVFMPPNSEKKQSNKDMRQYRYAKSNPVHSEKGKTG